MIDVAPIRDFIQTQLLRSGSPEPGEDDPLFSNGRIDSFGVIELIAFLEEQYDIVINTTKHHITDFDTLRMLAKIIWSEKEAASHG